MPKVSGNRQCRTWRMDFRVPIGCVDLVGTSWAKKAELQWAPTLAAAMPKDTIWPGKAQRTLIEDEILIG